ncbi:hypothetical protein BOTCAL_0316g00070 [Botryotinia calthae]|uniref:Uncharacterized protein n=1 Tax=Botryotinia calthae TaxID=38488 RepID=A0A4Y8CUD8_9HELO|nr:hypothetical protein BOTCAL_0316g00070 [Botryotinia calthae]
MMFTPESEERVESTETTETQDESMETVDSSEDDSVNILLHNTLHKSQEKLVAADEPHSSNLKILQFGSMRPVIDGDTLDYEDHWKSDRPRDYEFLRSSLREERGSPPPSEELYESYKSAAAATNGNRSSLFDAVKIFLKNWDNDNDSGNENGNYGQIIQQEFTLFGNRAGMADLESPTPRIVEGFRDGREYLEQLYESFDGAVEMIRDERTRSSAFCHFAGECAPIGTSFGREAVRLRYLGAFMVAERRLAFEYMKRFRSNKEYYWCDLKDCATVFTFMMNESWISLSAHFTRKSSKRKHRYGRYLEYHMCELLCLYPDTSYEAFKEAWTVLRNTQQISKERSFAIALEMKKSMQTAAWAAFNPKDSHSQDRLQARRRMAIEEWRSEEEMIQSRRNLDGMGPEDREAYFKLQEVRYD